jgi:hypothetical protein
VDRTSQPQGDHGGVDRPTRSRRRRQQPAAAAAGDKAVRDVRLTALVQHYRLAYEQAGQRRSQVAAEFSGFRSGQLVASIDSRPASPETLTEQFQLVCRTLAALDVDSAALLASDELALAVTASSDHPSDLAPFIIGLIVGPAGVEPAGTLIPYQLDRPGGTVTWGPPRPVRGSGTQGLWAEVLAPMCLNRSAPAGNPTLAELLNQNRRVNHRVLLLDMNQG